jgi:hypothetical protein
MRIPNRHFPTWKIKVLPPVTFAAAPRLFPKSRALTTTRLRGSITPAASRSVVYSVRWHMHSISSSTRNNYIFLNPIGGFDPRFLYKFNSTRNDLIIAYILVTTLPSMMEFGNNERPSLHIAKACWGGSTFFFLFLLVSLIPRPLAIANDCSLPSCIQRPIGRLHSNISF